jgi:hypothetical protein
MLSAQAPVVNMQNAKAQTPEIKSLTRHPTLVQLRAVLWIRTHETTLYSQARSFPT